MQLSNYSKISFLSYIPLLCTNTYVENVVLLSGVVIAQGGALAGGGSGVPRLWQVIQQAPSMRLVEGLQQVVVSDRRWICIS